MCKSREKTLRHSWPHRNVDRRLQAHQNQMTFISSPLSLPLPSSSSFFVSLWPSLPSSPLSSSHLAPSHNDHFNSGQPQDPWPSSHCQQTDAQERGNLISPVVPSTEEISHRSLASYYRIWLFRATGLRAGQPLLEGAVEGESRPWEASLFSFHSLFNPRQLAYVLSSPEATLTEVTNNVFVVESNG